MKIHLIWGTIGEYSDRTEWIAAAYELKEDAETALANLLELSKTLGVHRTTACDIDARAAAAENPLLKWALGGNSLAYDGVDFFLGETELIPARKE